MVLATVSSDGSPHLVPICSVIIGQCVYFAIDEIKPKATQRLVRLGNIEAEPRVSVLASHYEDDWSRLWWVRVDGVAPSPAGPAVNGARCARTQVPPIRPAPSHRPGRRDRRHGDSGLVCVGGRWGSVRRPRTTVVCSSDP